MDNEVIASFYRQYRSKIYLYLYSLCKSRELTEDLLQKTFLKAKLSIQNNHVNVRAWLYMVARNLYFNYITKTVKINQFVNRKTKKQGYCEHYNLCKRKRRVIFTRRLIILQVCSWVIGRKMVVIRKLHYTFAIKNVSYLL